MAGVAFGPPSYIFGSSFSGYLWVQISFPVAASKHQTMSVWSWFPITTTLSPEMAKLPQPWPSCFRQTSFGFSFPQSVRSLPSTFPAPSGPR